jgi:hypothetical protein
MHYCAFHGSKILSKWQLNVHKNIQAQKKYNEKYYKDITEKYFSVTVENGITVIQTRYSSTEQKQCILKYLLNASLN